MSTSELRKPYRWRWSRSPPQRRHPRRTSSQSATATSAAATTTGADATSSDATITTMNHAVFTPRLAVSIHPFPPAPIFRRPRRTSAPLTSTPAIAGGLGYEAARMREAEEGTLALRGFRVRLLGIVGVGREREEEVGDWV